MIILKSYIEYKDSGVKWIGNIPSHWEINKLKFLLSEPLKYGANEPAEYDELSWPRYIRITDIDEKGLLKKETFKSIPEDIAYPYLLKDEDILFARSGATVGKTFFYLKSFGKSAYAGYLIRARFKNKKIFSKFVYYFSHSKIYWEWIKSNFIQATIQNISAEKYSNLLFPLPLSLKEQRAIADYLDDKTKQIDALIEKKEQQVKLLQEKRSALITHIVTKGLNPKVKMKDSGVKWIEKIPEHWANKRIKHTTYVKGRIGWKGLKSSEFIEDGPYLVTGIDFLCGKVKWENCYHVSEERYLEDPYIQLKVGDLLITKDGTIGKLAIIDSLPGRATLNSGVFVTRPKTDNYISEFLYWILDSEIFIAFIDLNKTGTTISHLYQNVFIEFKFPFPSLSEQQTIAKYLDKETSKINAIILKIKQSIQLLKEYRSALITAAVTGKINVQKL